MGDRLEGKVAIITGAGTGVGRAAMVRFAREGARVVGMSRTNSKGEQTRCLVREAGGEGFFVPGDVREAGDARRVVEAAVERYGKLDILVNNASVGYSYNGSMAALADTPEADWDDVVCTNLKSVYLMSRYAIPEMRRAGGGAIVNVSSIGGVAGMLDAHAYSAAKGGVVALTRSMAATYGRENIRVNCLVPGGIRTEMIAPVLADLDAQIADPEMRYLVSALGRIGTAEEMANALLYLASDEASFTTGAALVVDGGRTSTM
jgi:NAD(P)-dependent dehydrogenase (short-subunit alcohol dehydrogenase family)